MHIILTGGTGYIGRCVLQIALRQGHRVTLLGADHAMAKRARYPGASNSGV
jgi:nucleoside-diphosphate-sugar epimerase